ncbi:MAG: OmpA family protein [Myxococcales bacterium]|nr:OmpA family protein [Myxococcales bacterium]
MTRTRRADRRARNHRAGAALFIGVCAAPAGALAAPPALPDDNRSGGIEADEPPAEGEPAAEGEAGGEASGSIEAGGEASVDAGADVGGAVVAPFAVLDVGDEEGDDAGAKGKGKGKGKGDAAKDKDPASIGGRREPAVNTVRGGLGLFGTSLADVGGQHSVRFGLHTDFFRRSGFIYDSSRFGQDTNSRFRGTVNIGYSPAKWGEVFLSISSQANRNLREQPGRQDAVTNFALGDIDLGFKGAHRFYRGGAIGLGGQLALGLLSGTTKLTTERVNFGFDFLFTLDVRYLTAKAFPFRFTTNIGWLLDNSLKILDWSRISDSTSREVTRFALGVNHSRVRMRYGVDFPMRFGKDRQFGIDPIAELSWDVSTHGEQTLFGQPGADPAPLPRSSLWSTLGVRANVVSGLHLDLALDIGMMSPNFEFAPPVPPWQLLLGLGYAFDPRPVIKEVPAEVGPPPPPPAVTDGRIVGQVVDGQGAPLAGAIISFPGLTTTSILTDESGSFTTFRFPEGEVTMIVTLANGQTQEVAAAVASGQETSLTVTFEEGGAAGSGILDGSFVDEQGAPVQASFQVIGQGIDEPFGSTADGVVRIELPAGDYRGIARAAGYEDAAVNFTITPGDEMIAVRATLKRGTPVETPNVSASGKGIRLKKSISFKGDEVSEKSQAILDELAIFLKGHPEFQEVEIGVHTDDRGNPGQRSTQRAENVRSYLLGQGVSPDRVVAKGYGDRNPIAVNLTASGRAKNNRVVLKVTKQSGGGE